MAINYPQGARGKHKVFPSLGSRRQSPEVGVGGPLRALSAETRVVSGSCSEFPGCSGAASGGCCVSTMNTEAGTWSRSGPWQLPPEGQRGDGNLPLPHISRGFSLSSGLNLDTHLSGKPSLTSKPRRGPSYMSPWYSGFSHGTEVWRVFGYRENSVKFLREEQVRMLTIQFCKLTKNYCLNKEGEKEGGREGGKGSKDEYGNKANGTLPSIARPPQTHNKTSLDRPHGAWNRAQCLEGLEVSRKFTDSALPLLVSRLCLPPPPSLQMTSLYAGRSPHVDLWHPEDWPPVGQALPVDPVSHGGGIMGATQWVTWSPMELLPPAGA